MIEEERECYAPLMIYNIRVRIISTGNIFDLDILKVQ